MATTTNEQRIADTGVELQVPISTELMLSDDDYRTDIVEQQPRITKLQCFGAIAKSFVGVGMLGLPFAMRNSGILSGIICLFLIGLASRHSIRTLIRLKNHVRDAGRVIFACLSTLKQLTWTFCLFQPHSTYEEIGTYVFGALGRHAVRFALVSSQIGFAATYVIFISTSLHDIYPRLTVNKQTKNLQPSQSSNTYVLLLFFFFFFFILFVLFCS